jgi:hypothetical protein
MKKDSAYVAIVLDRSGSMASVREATIDGFNEFINSQKAVPGECRVLLAQFDDIYETVFDKPLADVPPLTEATFQPRNTTALFDAMAKTINNLGEKLAAMPEADRPDRVLLATITDGHENASKEFQQHDVKRLVEQQTKDYQWDFVFIGANQDAVLTAQGFGIRADQALTYNANPRSVRAMAMAVSDYATATRRMAPAARAAGQRAAFRPGDRQKSRQ